MKNQRLRTEYLNETLYENMFTAQEKYRAWLLRQPAEEILRHTWEYTAREEILIALKYCEMKEKQLKALLKLPDPLEVIFCEYGRMGTGHIPDIAGVIEHCADRAVRKQVQAEEGTGHTKKI